MLIKKPADIPSSELTPQSLYLNRRKFLAGAALLWFGWRFYFVLVTLHVLVCLVLMGVILLQSGQAADWDSTAGDGISHEAR